MNCSPTRRILPAALLALGAAAWLMFSPSSGRSEKPAAAKPAAADLPRAVMNNHRLMELFNKQLYLLLKEEMQKKAGEEHWDTIADRGLQAAEVANLVALRNKQPKWQQLSAELQQAGLNLADAAKTENSAATREAYHALIQNCNDCHQAMAPKKAPQLKP